MPKTNVNGHSGAIAIYYVPRRNARVEKLRGTEQKSPLRCGKKKNRVSLSRICVRFNEDKAPSKKSPKCVFAILLACPPYSFVWIEKKKTTKEIKDAIYKVDVQKMRYICIELTKRISRGVHLIMLRNGRTKKISGKRSMSSRHVVGSVNG